LLITALLTILFASIHFLQRFGWTQATGRSFFTRDIALIYSGYLLLIPLSYWIFWLHRRIPVKGSRTAFQLLSHAVAAMLFSSLYNLLFSIAYYALNPAWQEYSFWLLFKDIALNYFNLGLIFYLISLLISIGINSLLVPASANTKSEKEVLKVKDQRKTYFFPIDEIAYFTSADNYVKVHCGTEAVLMRESMASLEKKLDPNIFLRIHRTALVNKNYVAQVIKSQSQSQLVMTDETILPLSRRRKEALSLLEKE